MQEIIFGNGQAVFSGRKLENDPIAAERLFASKQHNHSIHQAPVEHRNQFNYCLTCRDWFVPIGEGSAA